MGEGRRGGRWADWRGEGEDRMGGAEGRAHCGTRRSQMIEDIVLSVRTARPRHHGELEGQMSGFRECFQFALQLFTLCLEHQFAPWHFSHNPFSARIRDRIQAPALPRRRMVFDQGYCDRVRQCKRVPLAASRLVHVEWRLVDVPHFWVVPMMQHDHIP